MLDEYGLDIGSEQMAELVADAGNTVCIYFVSLILFKNILLVFLIWVTTYSSFSSRKRIVVFAFLQGALRLSFCIGGPYGHGQRMRNVLINLSDYPPWFWIIRLRWLFFLSSFIGKHMLMCKHIGLSITYYSLLMSMLVVFFMFLKDKHFLSELLVCKYVYNFISRKCLLETRWHDDRNNLLYLDQHFKVSLWPFEVDLIMEN